MMVLPEKIQVGGIVEGCLLRNRMCPILKIVPMVRPRQVDRLAAALGKVSRIGRMNSERSPSWV
jgi:hypothetical protein